MDKVKYDEILDACALLPDFKILEGGDMTEIGEKVRIRTFLHEHYGRFIRLLGLTAT